MTATAQTGLATSNEMPLRIVLEEVDDGVRSRR